MGTFREKTIYDVSNAIPDAWLFNEEKTCYWKHRTTMKNMCLNNLDLSETKFYPAHAEINAS